jgi:hypothetical protein
MLIKKPELDEIYKYRVHGSFLRARAIRVDNEKKSKYFANLEKKTDREKVVHKKVENKEITEITEIKEILKEEKTFYECLYRYRTSQR